MKKLNIVLALFFISLTAGVLVMATQQCAQSKPAVKQAAETPLEKIPFDGKRTHEHVRKLCEIGPRPSGSEGMKRQQELLETHFKNFGAEVTYQRFTYRHPENNSPVLCANMIIRWCPERKERILLSAHYDTLPVALLDPPGRVGPFVGANDGGSGVAVLMELARHIPGILEKEQKKYGVDFVMLDAEEFMFRQHGRFCVGSEFFARTYAASEPAVAKKTKTEPRDFSYRWGILLDMVGGVDLVLQKERNSWNWRDTRPLVDEIWGIAEELGVREFVKNVRKTEITDDHVMLHNLGKIPTIDMIDLDYAWWHTSQDVPENCSPVKLGRVGWVVMEWVKRVK